MLKKIIGIFGGCLCLVLLVSCISDDTNVPKVPLYTNTIGNRFTVTLIGQFKDSLAYREIRGIYIIRDSTTEKEYLGVSGIGISELGSHLVGKIITPDER